LLSLKEALDNQSELVRQIIRNSPFPIAFLDRQERVIRVNLAFEKLFGYSRNALAGKPIEQMIVPENKQKEKDEYFERIRNGETVKISTVRNDNEGRELEVEVYYSPIYLEGQFSGIFAMYRDKSSEIKALKELRRERAYFSQLFDFSPNAIVLLNYEDRVVQINRAFEELFGYKPYEIKGSQLGDLLLKDRDSGEIHRYSREVMGKGKTIRAETVRVAKDGREIDVHLTAYPVVLDHDRLGAYVLYQDISDRKKWEKELHQLLHQDHLTGLYNRKYLYESLDEKLKDAEEQGKQVLFLYLDLDSFKEINDNYGHKAGDALLVSLAERFQKHYQDKMDICRIGGDEFILVINEYPLKTPEEYIKELETLFVKAFKIEGKKVSVTGSTGYAIFPEDGVNLDQLISRADARMYHTKKIKRIQRNPVRKSVTLEELLDDFEP